MLNKHGREWKRFGEWRHLQAGPDKFYIKSPLLRLCVWVCTPECEFQGVHKRKAAFKYAHVFDRVLKNAAVLVCRLVISGRKWCHPTTIRLEGAQRMLWPDWLTPEFCFLDFSYAFNTIQRYLMIHKLHQLSTTSRLFQLIHDFLLSHQLGFD